VSVESTVLVERISDGRVAVATLNRPEAYNALSTQLAKDLVAVFDPLSTDPTLRCVVLTGSGAKAFCAGADLKERADMTTEAWFDQHRVFEAAFDCLRRFPKPLIAAVNGVAAGGGLELALTTDFLVASTTARFGQPEVKVGIIPGGGAVQVLPSLIPMGLARQLLMTGELIDAQRALIAGLVNSLHEPERLLPEAIAIAEQIASNSPAAVRAVKAATVDAIGRPLDDAIERGLEFYNTLVDGLDRFEGVRAFNERRPPAFSD
jgi:enoyl-CoA hydratase